MAFKGLTTTDKDELKYEVVSNGTRLRLTRLLREFTVSEEDEVRIIRQNRAINIARSILGRPLYLLEADVDGFYQPAEHAWHYGEIEILMYRPNTEELVEILADLIQNEILDEDEVNEILYEANVSFSFDESDSYGRRDVRVMVLNVDDIETKEIEIAHPNIRTLVNRMEQQLGNDDFSGVLHSSASIFETLAKDVVDLETLDNQTLASFFDRYRKDSKLPEPVLDYILDIYKKRNIEPLAGHGSRKLPTIGREEAIIIGEMTKAFIRIEGLLARPVSPKKAPRQNKP